MEMQSLPLVVLLAALRPGAGASPVVAIGGIFGSNDTASHFHQIVKGLPRTSFTFHSYTVNLDPNPLRAVIDACRQLMPHKVQAILLSGSESSSSSVAVSHASAACDIPVIGISSRDAALSDKGVFTSYLRTVPPRPQQVEAWLPLLRRLGYSRVALVYAKGVDGRAARGKLEGGLQVRGPLIPPPNQATAGSRCEKDEGSAKGQPVSLNAVTTKRKASLKCLWSWGGDH
ncbi:glutamate [NMDA] receptor subunit 1-like [Hetaerina americana]|uniref:glutamate [NMDA] receptor subunit 1-like n=1 Tax=Hetaerina americana TaxID=62018 RepID=UPI003A7F56E3